MYDPSTVNPNLLRKGMLEQMAIEPYSSYYIANQNRFYFISPDNLLVGGKKLYNVLDKMIESPLIKKEGKTVEEYYSSRIKKDSR
ncbi:MAG TPA: hypothetical protein DCR81_07580 [Smithella sp.]|nr:hypothetical protein [Smithella sp.]